MFKSNHKFFIYAAAAVMLLSAVSFGQSLETRVEVASQKLDTMKRSITSTLNILKDEGKAGDAENLDSPAARLGSLEDEVDRLNSDLATIRGRLNRSEKFEQSDLDQVEAAVADLQRRSDQLLVELAAARADAGPASYAERKENNKKKKFLGIFGGGDDEDEYDRLMGETSPGRDRELFIVATREVRKKKYDVGRLLFQTIITTYPDSPYLPMAKLAVADSFFLEGSTSALIQAIAGYQDWLTFFPTHPLADRVVLKIAESEMRQIGLPDRDATRAHRAETRLKALIQNYPDSILRKEAEERLQQVQDNLALHNLYIANQYYIQSVEQKKGGLKGAQSRYREILDKYPNFSFMDEALYKLAVTYMIEEETDQAARYFQRIVADYPNSEYVKKATEQLQLIGANVPAPNPDRMNVMPPEDASFFQNFKNQLFGIYPMTIDKNGVLMTKNFDKEKFELIDQVIENQGELYVNQIPKALTTVITQRTEPAVTVPKN